MMIVIGLVGRIGAGKSTVARVFATCGAEVIDADEIAHEVLSEPAVVEAIAARFGAGAIDAAGRVRRPVLAAAVFGANPEHERSLEDLERIVHPRVRQRIEARLAELAGEPLARPRLVVLDVPLLVQTGWDRRCDRLVLVECPEPERQRRLAERGWPAEQRAARERAWERGWQSPPAAKTSVVDAAGDSAYTRDQVERIFQELTRE
jgi:dephospho-CoA kinase